MNNDKQKKKESNIQLSYSLKVSYLSHRSVRKTRIATAIFVRLYRGGP